MPQRIEQDESGGCQFRLPAGVVLKPQVSAEDLKAVTEYDPEEAEEFVSIIRLSLNGGARSIAISWIGS